jgi:hypothetical protein
MNTRVKALVVLSATAAVGLLSAGSGSGSSSAPITACWQTVTTNAVLTQDLSCPGDGVVVGASGITIDLHGFRLTGTRGTGHYGINDLGGYDGVTVKNGVIRNFDEGIAGFSGADSLHLSNLIVSGNGLYGIIVSSGDQASVSSVTASGNAGYGVYVVGDHVSVKSSTVSGNGDNGLFVAGDSASIAGTTASANVNDGLLVTGSAASVSASTATGNGFDGIAVTGDSAVLKGDRADANGFGGGTSDLGGLGVDVSWTTKPPKGSDLARGNDDPGDCVPAYLC